ncbi:glycine receptor subunit alpha-4, partial [Hyalella azteca]|uniref:Glycine receptor subunit alpha-4 n=1 Tax=Hyalella azteca TaxID=294128 RepID=A0A979FLG1_HYAAZ
PLRVNVEVLLLSLSSPDESSLKYEVEFLLRQVWIDPRMKHDDNGRHSYLSGMHHVHEIWLPDPFFIKHGDFKEPLSPDHIALKIFSNGTVDYTRRRHLILSCIGNLNIFPFDDPACTFSIESKSYEEHELVFEWRKTLGSNYGKHLEKKKKLSSLNAYIISNETRVCETTFTWREKHSCLQVNLNFTRDDSFYFSTVFSPGIILVTSSFITFWLEWNAVPARVMIGVTTMLNFFTTSNSFRSTLPVVSNLSAMNVWDSVCMFFIYVSLLESVVVNNVGRKRPKHNMVYMPGDHAVIQCIPQAIHRIGLSLTVRNRGTNGHTPGSAADTHEMVTPACGNCDSAQTSTANTNNCNAPTTEEPETCEPKDVSQVEYTFQQPPRKNNPPHPIRVAKSIDVISRVVFPVGYAVFLLSFFGYRTKPVV